MALQLASCCCNTAENSKMYSGTVIPNNSKGPTFQFIVQRVRGGSAQPGGTNSGHQMQPVQIQAQAGAKILSREILADLITALLERRSFEELLKTLHELQSNRAYGIASRGSSSYGTVLRFNGSHCAVGPML